MDTEKIEEEIICKCGHELWHHENYSDLQHGSLIGSCCGDNCNCKIFRRRI